MGKFNPLASEGEAKNVVTCHDRDSASWQKRELNTSMLGFMDHDFTGYWRFSPDFGRPHQIRSTIGFDGLPDPMAI